MMKHQGVPAKLLSAFVLLLSLVETRGATAADIQWEGPDLGDFNDTANWAGDLKPDGGVNEAAAININTTAALAVLYTTDFTPGNNSVNGVKLGQAAAQVGGLRITNGGSLTSAAGSTETGAVQVGVAGQGNLTILGGGTLNAITLSLGGVAASSINLGDTSGLTATLNLTGTGGSTLNRTTNITGRFVTFAATGNLTLGSNSILTGLINHATLHSPLISSGTATLGGVFKPSFSGVTPASGNKWTLVDAATVAGSFSSIDTSAAPALGAGLAYQVITANGGTKGRIAQLSVEEVLTLNVNRNTGVVSISNIGTTAKTIDGYSILSSRGALTGTWNSLQDQAVAGWVESPPGGTPTDLSELNPQNSSTIAGSGGSLALGSPYQQVFPTFGTDPDHLEFEYTLTDTRIIDGLVAYTGTKVINDLVLNVNATTGAVQLKNDSPYDIFIDGYAVYSAAGTLKPANGQWSSLQDQAVTGWEEALPTATAVSELKADGSMRLTAGSGFNLGTLFTGGGTQDLRLEFLQQGFDGPTEGTVVYGAFGAVGATSAGVLADFNNNGVVDAADYVMWRNAQGTNTILRNDPIGGPIGTAQYNLWRANFGRSISGGSGAVLASVPEPGSALLLIAALVAVTGSRGVRGLGHGRKSR